MQGLYPDALSGEMPPLVVDRTMESGDLRVGIDLLKRAGVNAERSARPAIKAACEMAQYTHLDNTVRTLKKEERRLLGLDPGAGIVLAAQRALVQAGREPRRGGVRGPEVP